MLFHGLLRFFRGGGMRPVVVVVLLAALFVAFPDRNFSLGGADAASSSPACASGVGVGGTNNGTAASTAGGNGCVVIKYVDAGVVTYETFNYTGVDQTWTVPSGVTSVIFYLLGAGGGGVPMAGGYGDGGGGGYATGTYTVSSGQVLTVIVGQGGGGELLTLRSGSGTNGCYTGTSTYGGGGRGSSCWSGYAYADRAASGGGRSAVRIANGTEVVTAAGGGGGGWTSNGGAGGGTSGTASSDSGGGTQTAGGTVTNALATSGAQYLGGNGYHQGGGGGGGYYGGGGGYSTSGGGGGSSYVSLLTSGSTTAGSGTTAGASVPSTSSLGGCNISNHIASMSVSQTSDGGSPIINYEYHIATSKPASQPTQWTPFDPAQTSSPLTWDMRALGYSSGSYRWYVRAINVIGASTGSWLSNSDSSCGVSVTPTAPAAPTSLSATAGSGSASISFTAGSSNGATITNYSYSTNGTTYTLLSPVDASSPVTIPGLTGGTAYTIYLKAINSAGTSSASSSVSVTPLAAAPTVSSVSGTSGTAAGGTSITITGTNFLSGATVTVGGAACTSVTVVSSTSITCTTPAGTAGAQNIVVTNTDTQSATLSGGFTYIATPSTPSTPDLDSGSDSGSSSSDNVTSDSTPTISVGSVSNGNTVTVTATKAGSTSVTCTFTAAVGTTSCDLGTLSEGVWSITSKQTNSGIDSVASSALSLTIDTTLPTVSSFSSTTANGSYGVGTAINITATMSEAVADGASITVTLDTGDTVVLTKATSTTLTGTYTVGVGDTSSDLNVSSYVLTSAPADTAGNVMTSTAVPSSANNIAGAHAIAVSTTPPVVSAVSSSSGSVSGGTAITITGTGFASGATVTIGGSSCTSVVVVSSTSITCTTPAGTTGAKNVVVTNSDTQASTLTGGFTYLPAAPGTPDVDTGSDTGSSNSDNITSDNTPTLSVSGATNGNTVTVTATKAGSTSVTCTFTATAQSSCDLGTLADGVWSVTSKQTGAGVDSVISAAVSLTIDTTRPTVSSFSSTTANGKLGVGGTANITATMSEDVADGASITVTLDTGDTVVLTKATSTTLTGTYTVGTGDTSSDLNVSSYVLTSAPADTAGNVMTSTTVPSGANNIAGAHAIVIDTAGPTLTSTSINSAGTQITLTYNEALHATSAAVGDFGVSIGLVAKTISSITISGSTVVLTISPAAAIGDIVTVVYTAPTSNSATSNSAVQDTVGNDAASSTSTATVTAAPATTVPAASGGSPSSATTTTTLPTTTTVPQTTTTVVPTVTTTTVAPRIRVTTTTAAPRTRVSTTTVAPRTSSTSSSSTTSTTVFRPMVPLAPVSTLPRATSTTSSTTTSTTTTTTTTTTSTTIARSTYVNLGSAEKALDSAKKLSSDSVVSAQLAVAELRLSVIDSKSAVVVAVRDAQKEVEKLKADKAANSEIAVAEQKVLDLKLAVAESKSISVEKILAAESALTSVLADSRSTAVQVANAVATLTEARTPSFDEAVAIVGTVTGDYTVPVVVPGVVDSAGSGNFVMLENDVQKVIELKRVNESVMVLSSSDGFKISIAAVDKDGNPFAFNSRGAVVVKHGNFIAIAGEGFAPGSVAKTWLFSSPRELGLVNVDAQGKFSAEFRIEQDVRIGDHISQVNGLSPGGETRSVNIDVEILPNVGPAPFDPLTQPRGVLTLVAELVALMGVMGVARRREEDEERESADVADVAVVFGGADVDRDVDRLAVLSVGVVDRVSVALPHRAVKVSPLLAGVFGDAVYLRALLGVFWLVLPIVGGVFGFGAASSTGFDAVMPSLWWLTALVVLGAFDALSGFIGAMVFAVAVGVGGGLVSGDSVRGLLGVWVFCFAVPLIASATRPFRRARRDGEQTSWLRTVDFVLVVLFGAWVAGAMYSALPGLTGFNSPSAGFVTHIRVAVLVALVARFAFENLAVVATPVRLKSLVGQPLEQPIPGQELVSIFVRLAVYLFVAVVFIGNNWALWLGGLIYLVPKLVGLVSDKLPDFKPVHRFLPRGIFKVVLMLFVAKWWGGLIANQVDNPADMIKIGFVALGVPGLTLTAIGWFARSSRKWPSTILTKLLGTALLIIGVLVVLDIWAKI